MTRFKFVALIVVSIVIAVLLATALASFTRVSDSALAEVATPGAGAGAGLSRPSTSGTNYLPIIFLNSATAGGAWLLAGNAGTNSLTDFLGTTDNMTLTFRVSNTIAYRIVPAVDPLYGWAPNLIGGSEANGIAPGIYGATIAGGGLPNLPNVITASYATIGGGFANTASGHDATVGGGNYNTASGLIATIGGGQANTASGFYAATVGGGSYNTASGTYATIPGGVYNVASEHTSFAAGCHAKANHAGAFVWADSSCTDFASSGNDQFLIRANGGVGIGTNNPGAYAMTVQRNGGTNQFQVGRFKNASTTGDLTTIVDLENGNVSPTKWRLSVGGAGNGLGLPAGQFYLERNGAGVALQIDANRDVHFFPSLGGSCNLTNGAVGWACSSDRNLKENIVRANGEEILARVAELPVSTWNMKGASATHIGPMAQDFYAAFGVGEDDKHINTVDAQGVALAAIQGLAQENKELKALIAEQAMRVSAQDARLAALEANQSQNVFAVNNLPLWGALGLLAVWAMRKKR